jgi:hypothetical protein
VRRLAVVLVDAAFNVEGSRARHTAPADRGVDQVVDRPDVFLADEREGGFKAQNRQIAVGLARSRELIRIPVRRVKGAVAPAADLGLVLGRVGLGQIIGIAAVPCFVRRGFANRAVPPPGSRGW